MNVNHSRIGNRMVLGHLWWRTSVCLQRSGWGEGRFRIISNKVLFRIKCGLNRMVLGSLEEHPEPTLAMKTSFLMSEEGTKCRRASRDH